MFAREDDLIPTFEASILPPLEIKSAAVAQSAMANDTARRDSCFGIEAVGIYVPQVPSDCARQNGQWVGSSGIVLSSLASRLAR